MPNTELLIRAAVAALNAGHDIRASSELALRMQLAVAELEQERLYYQIEALEAELVAARAGTPDGTAWLNERLTYEQGERERAIRRAAQWRKLAKLRRQQVREIEAAVARRDERIRIQDGAITRLTASRDRALAGVPDAPADTDELRRENERLRQKLVALKAEAEPATKICRDCGNAQGKDAFYPSVWRDQAHPRCKACQRIADQKRRGRVATPPAPEPELLPFEPEPASLKPPVRVIPTNPADDRYPISDEPQYRHCPTCNYTLPIGDWRIQMERDAIVILGTVCKRCERRAA